MKTTGLAIVMAMGWSSAISGGTPGRAHDSKTPLTVCFGTGENVPLETRAELVASGVFAKIGVRVHWRGFDKCPEKTIRIEITKGTPVAEHPGALAYALPYEGTRIVVMLDRVKVVGPDALPYVLGHVIAHEVTHILQGVVRHSDMGVMKEFWNTSDYKQMAWEPLKFAREDIALINRGLELRASSSL